MLPLLGGGGYPESAEAWDLEKRRRCWALQRPLGRFSEHYLCGGRGRDEIGALQTQGILSAVALGNLQKARVEELLSTWGPEVKKGEAAGRGTAHGLRNIDSFLGEHCV